MVKVIVSINNYKGLTKSAYHKFDIFLVTVIRLKLCWGKDEKNGNKKEIEITIIIYAAFRAGPKADSTLTLS